MAGVIQMGVQFGRRVVEDEFEPEAPPLRARPAVRIGRRFEAADRVLVAGVAVAMTALAGIGGHLWLQSFGFDSDGITIRHLFAGIGCSEAKMVDLAPAYRGQPGYYAAFDPDGDGRSCVAPVI